MDRWRLLAYKYGDGEQRPSNFDGHASAIRFNSSNQKIEFVDHDGFLVSDLEEIKWEKFDFGPKKKPTYLFTSGELLSKLLLRIQFCVVLIHFRVVLIRFHVVFMHFRVTFTLSP